MARGSTHTHGAKCVVANTYGMFHTRSRHGYTRLTWGSKTTPDAPEASRLWGAAGCTRFAAELVVKGYTIVYTDRSSKTLGHKDMHRACGFGVFAPEDDQGPEVRFCGYVPTRHRQTNSGAELWAALEGLQGFLVPKLAILTDSQYLQLGATRRAQHWKSKGWTTSFGKLQVHVPVWEMLLHETEKPGRDVKWNEVANGLAMEGMCSGPLWSKQVLQDSSDSESTVVLRGGSGSESEDTQTPWASLGLVPMDSDEMIGEVSGGPAPRGAESCSWGSEESRVGYMPMERGGYRNKQSQNPNRSVWRISIVQYGCE